MNQPHRGEVWVVDLGLAAKVRPCFEVSITTRWLRSGVFDAQNVVTIPHAKLVRRLGRLTSTQLTVIE